jgi:hypothetical protein|tara:strand:+ start:106 stop:246 length:141 start_codon:yes stop_codon:yes gene_type:complete
MEFVVNKKIDCKKITTIEEIKLILDSLDLHMGKDCPHYDKLKHLLK